MSEEQDRSQAQIVMWVARAAIGLELWIAWKTREELSLGRITVGALVLIGLLVVQQMARSYALGWTTDENGERQKVKSRVRGRAFFYQTTYRQRLIDEDRMRSGRRLALGLLTPLAAGTIWLACHLHRDDNQLAFGAVSFVGFFIVVGWLICAVREVLYQSGYQDMQGHQVRDPEPLTNLGVVAAQKAHGDAGIATEDEALKLLRPDSPSRVASMLDAQDIYLGTDRDTKSDRCDQDLLYGGERHLLLFGPNGTGKGTRLLIPNLLRLTNRSIVVIDPKGELAAVTGLPPV